MATAETARVYYNQLYPATNGTIGPILGDEALQVTFDELLGDGPGLTLARKSKMGLVGLSTKNFTEPVSVNAVIYMGFHSNYAFHAPILELWSRLGNITMVNDTLLYVQV